MLDIWSEKTDVRKEYNFQTAFFNDLDSATFCDDRIEETIIVAAQLLLTKVEFSTDDTIDADTLTISPDPTLSSPKDNDFINLTALQTACILSTSQAKTLAAQSYRITDGPSSVDVGPVYKAMKEMAGDICSELEDAIFSFGVGIGGQAILGPYTQSHLPGFPGANFS